MFVVDVKFHTASAARRRAVASPEQAGGQLPRVASSHVMICPFNPRTSPIGGSALWRSTLRDPSLNLRRNDSVLGVRRQQKPNLDCRECLVAPNADILNRLLYSPFGRREYTYRAARRKRRGNARFESRRCRDWPARLRCGHRKFPRSLSSYRKDIEIDRKRLPALEGHFHTLQGLVAAMLASRYFKGIRRKRLPIFMLGADHAFQDPMGRWIATGTLAE